MHSIYGTANDNSKERQNDCKDSVFPVDDCLILELLHTCITICVNRDPFRYQV